MLVYGRNDDILFGVLGCRIPPEPGNMLNLLLTEPPLFSFVMDREGVYGCHDSVEERVVSLLKRRRHGNGNTTCRKEASAVAYEHESLDGVIIFRWKIMFFLLLMWERRIGR